MSQALTLIAQEVRSCTNCRLHQGTRNGVPGEGNPQAEILFVGEGPGFHEDAQGRPFVGPAGKLLDEMLGRAGLKREDVFIANIVKHRPPGNRDPLPDEIEDADSSERSRHRALLMQAKSEARGSWWVSRRDGPRV